MFNNILIHQTFTRSYDQCHAFPIYVLWVGCPECYATWEPASSLPQDLIENFESGVSVETRVHLEPLYGHISGTITVSEMNITKVPVPKKARKQRQCLKDLEGYVGFLYIHASNECFNFTALLKMLKKHKC